VRDFITPLWKIGLGFSGFTNELENILINTCLFIKLGCICVPTEWVFTNET